MWWGEMQEVVGTLVTPWYPVNIQCFSREIFTEEQAQCGIVNNELLDEDVIIE